MNKKYDIIYAPIITEKTAMMEAENKYAFKVDPRANKTEIKQAIEAIYKVKVVDIATVRVLPKKRRVGKYEGYRSAYKKAIVKLAKDEKIDAFNI